jgi:hypothetical protein
VPGREWGRDALTTAGGTRCYQKLVGTLLTNVPYHRLNPRARCALRGNQEQSLCDALRY